LDRIAAVSFLWRRAFIEKSGMKRFSRKRDGCFCCWLFRFK